MTQKNTVFNVTAVDLRVLIRKKQYISWAIRSIYLFIFTFNTDCHFDFRFLPPCSWVKKKKSDLWSNYTPSAPNLNSSDLNGFALVDTLFNPLPIILPRRWQVNKGNYSPLPQLEQELCSYFQLRKWNHSEGLLGCWNVVRLQLDQHKPLKIQHWEIL